MGKKFITWNEFYELGIDKIDEQHKKLVDMINRLYDAFMEGKAQEITDEILDEMEQYAYYHFKTEEDIFSEYEYPDTETHLLLHTVFFEKTSLYKEEFIAGKEDIHYKLLDYLKDWLLNHIQGADVKYVEYFKKQNITL
ncbi:MAG: hemerythrin [Bacteroidetes bacterium]|nr:MAG: hemerythrin [Bacteroidota bacterium]